MSKTRISWVDKQLAARADKYAIETRSEQEIAAAREALETLAKRHNKGGNARGLQKSGAVALRRALIEYWLSSPRSQMRERDRRAPQGQQAIAWIKERFEEYKKASPSSASSLGGVSEEMIRRDVTAVRNRLKALQAQKRAHEELTAEPTPED